MSWAARLSLRLFHLIYSFYLAIWSFHCRWLDARPKELTDTRPKVPQHLAITLACSEDEVGDHAVNEAFVTCAERAAAWCRQAGIRRLTLYDRHGILLGVSDILKQRFSAIECTVQPERAKSATVYPLTPPSSDDSDSQLSGEEALGDGIGVVTVLPEYPENEIVRKAGRSKGVLRRRGSRRTSFASPSSIVVQVASQTAGKSMIVSVANRLLCSTQQNCDIVRGSDAKNFTVSVTELQYVLEGEHGFPAPDLMIIHHVTCPSRQRPPMELHAFPPWQIRLTEFFYDGSWSTRSRILRQLTGFLVPCRLLSELGFRKALDDFANAQFRVGR